VKGPRSNGWHVAVSQRMHADVWDAWTLLRKVRAAYHPEVLRIEFLRPRTGRTEASSAATTPYLVFSPITASESQVAMPGKKHIRTTATIISATNGITPQITSRSGMSGAMFLMTNRLSPTGG
jgi:hypothetical protein